MTFCLAFACGSEDAEDSSLAGNLGEACIGGTFCNNNLQCINGVCMEGSGETGSGDGDGDTSGDGDTTGDGDGDTSSSGDGDGDTTGGGLGLYEGPCLTSDECEGDLWCATANGRYWCAQDCDQATDCPMDASASAVPDCRVVLKNDGVGGQDGCVLDCADESECPAGAQCFASGIGSTLWCGFLP